MKKGLFIFGLLILLVGLVIGPTLWIAGATRLKGPEDSNLGIVYGSGGNVTLEKGEYEIWTQGGKPETLRIIGPDGVAFLPHETSGEFMIGGQHIYGRFMAKEDGEYTFTYDRADKLYITGEHNMAFSFVLIGGGCCLGAAMIPVGFTLSIVGLVTERRKKKR